MKTVEIFELAVSERVHSHVIENQPLEVKVIRTLMEAKVEIRLNNEVVYEAVIEATEDNFLTIDYGSFRYLEDEKGFVKLLD